MRRYRVSDFGSDEVLGHVANPDGVGAGLVVAVVGVVPTERPLRRGVHIAEVINAAVGPAPEALDEAVGSQSAAAVVEAGDGLLPARRAGAEAGDITANGRANCGGGQSNCWKTRKTYDCVN